MVEVSIIIPNYNHAPYLKQRLDTVLAQTFQDFEVIILDDCSTDNSKEVIAEYADHPKISHVIFNTSNSGSPFLQWEKGINLATGRYVWIAESDDWCEPSLLQDLVEGIRKDDDCVLSYCQMYYINGDNKIKWQSSHKFLSEIVDSGPFIRDYLAVKVSIYNASMAIFRRDKFKNVSRDFTTYKFSGDRLFWIQIAMQGKTHISGKVLNYFRKHDRDVSGKAYATGLNFIEEFNIIDWMYKTQLIDDSIYAKAFKKQYKEYWAVRNTIDPVNRHQIRHLFNHPLSSNANKLRFLPSAIWKAFKNKN
ncbi:glycosyltransferase family 2 protein [Arcticibacter sp.]|uniref:glycosyltransferase family 2 protein n=1 Tax=Arcticibacter sp. TaxID=1872630 RepID=UPI00388F60AD